MIPHAAAILTKVWRDEFKVEAHGDTFVVQTPTLQTVEAFVVAQLATPEYASFVRAQNPAGGTGGVPVAGQTLPTPTGTAAPADDAPKIGKNMGETILMNAALLRKDQTSGNRDMTQTFGLRRRRADLLVLFLVSLPKPCFRASRPWHAAPREP